MESAPGGELSYFFSSFCSGKEGKASPPLTALQSYTRQRCVKTRNTAQDLVKLAFSELLFLFPLTAGLGPRQMLAGDQALSAVASASMAFAN